MSWLQKIGMRRLFCSSCHHHDCHHHQHRQSHNSHHANHQHHYNRHYHRPETIFQRLVGPSQNQRLLYQRLNQTMLDFSFELVGYSSLWGIMANMVLCVIPGQGNSKNLNFIKSGSIDSPIFLYIPNDETSTGHLI